MSRSARLPGACSPFLLGSAHSSWYSRGKVGERRSLSALTSKAGRRTRGGSGDSPEHRAARWGEGGMSKFFEWRRDDADGTRAKPQQSRLRKTVSALLAIT